MKSNQARTPVLHADRLPQRLALRWLTKSQSNASAGFTLIESLVAIIIIAVTIVSITPPIFWATATRVQNRRVEQAVQLAQSEIDRVRVAVERKTATVQQIPPVSGTTLRAEAPAPNSVIPVTTKLRSIVPGCEVDDGNQPALTAQAVLVDTDPEPAGSANPCEPEFLVQTFRGNAVTTAGPSATATDGFVMGVRVYSIVARDNIENGTAQAEPGTLRATNGLGTQAVRPLAVQYSTIVRSNRSDGLSIYRQLCDAAGQACFSANPPTP